MTSCASSNKVLILNGVEDYLQIILGAGEEVLWHWQIKPVKGSMPVLAPHLDYLLKTFHLSLSDLKAIYVFTGPGSFTGLRLVFAHAYGLALAGNVPLLGLNYFLSLARSVPLKQIKWIITHSRHQEVYAQPFDSNNNPLLEPSTYTLEELKNALKNYPQALLLGSGVRRNPEIATWKVQILPPQYDLPCAQEVVKLTQEQDTSPFKKFPLPLYLRKSNAEENLNSIAQKRGIDFEEAKKILGKPLKVSLD